MGVGGIKVSCDAATVGVATRCTASMTLANSDGSSFPVKVLAYDNEQGGQPSQAEAVERARRFDVITAGPFQYASNVGAMKQANPDLILAVYRNGTHTKDAGLREDQYCHDATGARITTTGTWSGNILMDPGSGAWWSTLLDHVTVGLVRSGYDDVYLDVLGRGALLYNVTGRCINPRTGREYTVADWERDTAELARFIKQQTGRHVVGNGASSGSTYFGTPPSSLITQYIDGGLSEGFTRNGAFYDGYYSETQIGKDIQMVADSPTMHVLVKDWRSVTEEQKDQEMRYGFAAFLLGTDGTDVFGWTGSRTTRTSFDPLWDADLGTPSGVSYGLGGARYRRDFARGYVILDVAAHTGSIVVSTTGTPQVEWTTSKEGSFEPSACVAAGDGTVTCDARYVPASGSAGAHTITVTSIGDGGSSGPSASTSLDVRRRPTGTSVACATPVTLPSTSACTVTVSDDGPGDATAPPGQAEVSAAVAGGDPIACTLAPVSPSASACTLEYALNKDGTVQLDAAYAGAIDHESSGSAPASVTAQSPEPAPAPAADGTAPSVDLTQPLDGATLPRATKVMLAASASDDVGVTKIVFAVNGSVKCTDTDPDWTCSWAVPGAAKTFVITATASDAAGNSSSDRISVITTRA